jgi:hypothetical protein
MKAALLLLLLVSACVPRRSGFELPESAPSGSFGEHTRVLALSPGVTATIVAPARLDATKPVDLILYALPNGNSTAETMGMKLADKVGWRYDIQHIAAQTRALRMRGLAQAVVVYLEADRKSWPEWRRVRGYDSANARIVSMVDEIRAAMGHQEQLAVTLTGHSGGGSLMFGFIEGQNALPDWLDRIAFLDANYNFDARHGAKLNEWLRRSRKNTLVSLAYDDREIMLDGKKVVSDSGGTWRASRRMIEHFRSAFAITQDTLGDFVRHRDAQIEILVHPNPANRILHTEMIGEMNGYMHALLVRRAEYERGEGVLKPARVYGQWVEAGPTAAAPRAP